MEVSEIFIKTCTKSKYGNYYTHFGIDKKFVNIWGNKLEDILEVKMCISENQSLPNINEQEYWGWYDFERKEFTIIYSNYKQFSVCFPYGIKVEEDSNKGKAYRLKIVEIIN